MTKYDFIDEILMEVCLDLRVKSGMFEPSCQEHIDVLIEVMFNRIGNMQTVCEFTNKLNEGKYPDRQAYTKDGFLVTFPTPTHRQNALMTGEYFSSDPTHGKGGMHLVRKAPVVQQPTQPTQQPQVAPIKPSTTQQPKPKSSPTASDSVSQSKAPQAVSKTPITTSTTVQQQKQQPSKIVQTPVPQKKNLTPVSTPLPTQPIVKGVTQPTQQNPKKQADVVSFTGTPPVKTELDLPGDTEYKDPSLEWAHNQKWDRRENKNYYDGDGNLMAMTGLDGKVVPASDAGRQSLKNWVEKKKLEKINRTK